jgi:hypothetical protein
MSRWLTILLVGVVACGGDSNDPDDPFPDASGEYQMTGGFDGIPTSVASFEGTLDLSQASQQSGDLEGAASITAVVQGDVFAGTDEDVSPASVSANGEIAFTMVDAELSWAFTGTLSGSNITNGRHTLTDGSSSISGGWSASRVSGIRASVKGDRAAVADLRAAIERLRSR